jgi:hypothetical protein
MILTLSLTPRFVPPSEKPSPEQNLKGRQPGHLGGVEKPSVLQQQNAKHKRA